jgi:DNA-binding beta-propeller fold protein YncE
MIRSRIVLPLLAMAACATRPDESAPRYELPGRQDDGRILLPNGWRLDPHGEQLDLPSDLPVRMCVHPSGTFVAVQHAGYRDHLVVVLDAARRRIVSSATLPHTWSGMCWSRDGDVLYVSGGRDDVVLRFPFDANDGKLGEPASWPVGVAGALDLPAGMCTGRDGELWVCLQRTHRLLELDARGSVVRSVDLPEDSFPFEPLLARDGREVLVSLWNRAEVWAIDADDGTARARIATGQHPSEMLLDPDGGRVFVSNGNENAVDEIDLASGRTVQRISSSLVPNAPPGSTPNALALAEGRTLIVANADNNDCALIDVSKPGFARPLGFVPVGCYPTSVRVLPGNLVVVANGKGGRGSHANPEGPVPGKDAERATDYTGGLYDASLSLFPLPSASDLADLSKRVFACAPSDAGANASARRPADSPIPEEGGGESPIRYVVYVIKENRTYDQLFGDLPQGNGDPNLCLFPRNVTPNHHALAEEFVLLDNVYVDSEVSADGHEWSMGAYASDFVQRTWPVAYRENDTRRTPEGAAVDLGYPSEGNFTLSTPKNGYLWDLAAAAGITYRSYGEFVANPGEIGPAMQARAPALVGHFCPEFRSFDLAWPDAKRVDAFVAELSAFEKGGDLPRLCVVRLPQDHTAGTRAGDFTPRSCVAENDLALGRLIEALSRSRFWPRTAVFVIEDDAQNGPDHVDAHRTVALLAGPFVKRHAVVHTMYSTCNLVRTMERILGLPPMSQFDTAARPMFDCFAGTPNAAPYRALENRVPTDERNLPTAWGAALSATFDLSKEDAADDLLLNEVVWRSVRGPEARMPAPVHAAFVRALDDGDEDD